MCVVFHTHLSCLCVYPVSYVKMGEWILMPFGSVDRVGARMCSMDDSVDCPIGRGNFRGGLMAQYNQCGIYGLAVEECMKQSRCHLEW